MTPAEILRAAKAEIETGGWLQGRPGSLWGDGPCCASRAITRQSIKVEFSASYAYLARCFLANAAGIAGPGDIPDWNDRPGRTKEEVLAAFDKAIELAEKAS